MSSATIEAALGTGMDTPAGRKVAMDTYQHLRAPNTLNGNPQRLYAVYRKPTPGFDMETRDEPYRPYSRFWEIVAVYDEGYQGLPEALRGMAELPAVNISERTYYAMVHDAREQGILL